jgi:hypothetical protein
VKKGVFFALALVTIISMPLLAQGQPRDWVVWKTSVISSGRSLELQELSITEYNDESEPVRNRKVSARMATRAMSGNDNLPGDIRFEDLPTLFFNLPWEFAASSRITTAGPAGSQGIALRAEGPQVAHGQVWFNPNTGHLVETVLRFNDQPLPRITVRYRNDQIISMTIRTPSDARNAEYRDAEFIYD